MKKISQGTILILLMYFGIQCTAVNDTYIPTDQASSQPIASISPTVKIPPESVTFADEQLTPTPTFTAIPKSTSTPTKELSTPPKKLNLVNQKDWASQAIALQDDFAFLACLEDGICILDISDPTNPILTGMYDVAEVVRDVKVVGKDTIYVRVSDGSFRILDTSEPTKPQEVGIYPYAGTMEVLGQIAYIAAGEDGLRILDISNPASPYEIGIYQLDGVPVFDIAVNDKLAYVAAGQQGLRVIDISDPTMPEEITAYNFPVNYPYHLRSVVSVDDIVYLTGFREWVYVIDVSEPTKPNKIAVYQEGSNWGPELIVIDNIAYVYILGNLCLLDISDPKVPKDIDCYNLENEIEGPIDTQLVAVIGDTVYVTNGEEGLFIFSVEGSE